MGGKNYSSDHQRARAELLADDPLCSHCGIKNASVADHSPPIALHDHVAGTGCCEYLPSCRDCSDKQAHEVKAMVAMSPKRSNEITFDEPDPSPGPSSDLWQVPWLLDLLDVPELATWPRWMTAPHPDAVDSIGAEFELFVVNRTGSELRWWQKLVARRILEVDIDGNLVWMSWLLSVARQVGKSFLVLELLMFATVHVRRFWQADGVLFVARTLTLAEGLLAPSIRWALDTDDWHAGKSRGTQYVRNVVLDAELRVRAVGGAYGSTNGLAVCDEAWDIKRSDVEEGVRPTLLDAEGMLGLTSTAHRKARSLMLNERTRCFDQLDEPRSRLMVEWGADRARDLDDRDGWREASPVWSDYREELIADAYEAAVAGESLDVDEPDPIKAFSAQYLNQWPIKQTRRGPGETLFDTGAWAMALVTSEAPQFQRVAAITDNFGKGASVVVAGISTSEKIAVTGESFEDRDEAYARIDELADSVDIVLVEALLAHDQRNADIRQVSELFGPVEIRRGLGGLRDAVTAGSIVHDGSPDLADQVIEARIRNGTSGISLASAWRHDAVRGMAGAVARVQKSISIGATIEVL